MVYQTIGRRNSHCPRWHRSLLYHLVDPEASLWNSCFCPFQPKSSFHLAPNQSDRSSNTMLPLQKNNSEKLICGHTSLSSLKTSPPSAAYMRRWTGSALIQIMACLLFSAKPLPEPMLFLSIGPLRKNLSEILIEIKIFSFMKIHLKMSSAKWRPFCPGWDELKSTSNMTVKLSCRRKWSYLWKQCSW